MLSFGEHHTGPWHVNSTRSLSSTVSVLLPPKKRPQKWNVKRWWPSQLTWSYTLCHDLINVHLHLNLISNVDLTVQTGCRIIRIWYLVLVKRPKHFVGICPNSIAICRKQRNSFDIPNSKLSRDWNKDTGISNFVERIWFIVLVLEKNKWLTHKMCSAVMNLFLVNKFYAALTFLVEQIRPWLYLMSIQPALLVCHLYSYHVHLFSVQAQVDL